MTELDALLGAENEKITVLGLQSKLLMKAPVVLCCGSSSCDEVSRGSHWTTLRVSHLALPVVPLRMVTL